MDFSFKARNGRAARTYSGQIQKFKGVYILLLSFYILYFAFRRRVRIPLSVKAFERNPGQRA